MGIRIDPASMSIPIISPCIGLCSLDGEGLCEGCFRTPGEIAHWLDLDANERRRLMDEVLPVREAARMSG